MAKDNYFSEIGAQKFLLQGEVDFATVNSVLRAFGKLLASLKNINALEVSLAGLEMPQTIVLSLLLEMQRMAGKENIQTRFVEAPDSLQGIAKLNGVDDFIWGT